MYESLLHNCWPYFISWIWPKGQDLGQDAFQDLSCPTCSSEVKGKSLAQQALNQMAEYAKRCCVNCQHPYSHRFGSIQNSPASVTPWVSIKDLRAHCLQLKDVVNIWNGTSICVGLMADLRVVLKTMFSIFNLRRRD